MPQPLLVLLMAAASLQAASDVLIRTTEGNWLEGGIAIDRAGSTPLAKLLSMHNGAAASPAESTAISSGFEAIQAKDRALRDRAVEDLTSIGLPVVTPLLDIFKDTDQHEPKPLYNLFARVMPASADRLDREASLMRLKDGTFARGPWPDGNLKIKTPAGEKTIPWSQVRLLAVRQPSVKRQVEVHSLRHATQIEYLDTGIYVTDRSAIQSTARGFTRLSWKDDSWATGPNGLVKPGGNYKTNLVDGHPFGALLARIGSQGSTIFLGETYNKPAPIPGRLTLAINDNGHWQNNLGSYTVFLSAANAYDLGEAR